VAPLLLDTHVWYWVLEARADRIPPSVGTRLLGAMLEHVAFVSDISALELLLKAGRGRLELPEPHRAWVDRALEAPGIRTLPLSRGVLLDAVSLPGDAPRDPADRFIIATARQEALTLVTADRTIVNWARTTRAVRVLPMD
jgi:PIN domain nuclease of toxin-antitoxin system